MSMDGNSIGSKVFVTTTMESMSDHLSVALTRCSMCSYLSVHSTDGDMIIKTTLYIEDTIMTTVYISNEK